MAPPLDPNAARHIRRLMAESELHDIHDNRKDAKIWSLKKKIEKLEKELALTDWVDLSLPDATLPPKGRYVLTFGDCGYVVGYYNFDRGEWQAQHADRETGEPWLRSDTKPTHWQHIKFVYPYCGDRTQADPFSLPKPEATT